MSDLVSVIVPVYNVAEYLDECLESIVRQTYENIEIILIDGSSTDGSSLICQKWVKIDARIRYIIRPKEGLGPARNLGIELANGEYVMFVDSDDWVDLRFVEEMHKAISHEKADLAECDFYRIPANGAMKGLTVNGGFMKKEFTKEERLIWGSVTQWKIIARRDFLILSNIKQPALSSEDLAVHALQVALADKVVGVNIPLYYYRKGRIDSGGRNKDSYMKGHIAMQYLVNSFKEHKIFKRYREVLYRHLLRWTSRLIVPCLPELSKVEYDMLVISFKDFFKRNFPQYPWRKTVLIGSYNLTKIMQKTFLLENPYYRFQFTSLPALVSKAANDVPLPNHSNPYREYMLQREFRKVFWEMLQKERPDYIVIDFIEERHDLIEYKGAIFTKSDALIESDFLVNEGRIIPRYSTECRKVWEKACLAFIEGLKKYFIPDHVILVENVLAEKYGDIFGVQEFENADEIKRMNEILNSYYTFFKKNFKGIRSVNMQKDPLYVSDNQYEYGCYPWHLNGLINRKIGEAMNFGSTFS